MSCSIDFLERSARQFDALAASCLDEATAQLFRARARRCRELASELDSAGFLLGCGD